MTLSKESPGVPAQGPTQFVQVDSLRVATRSVGAGPPLVLLHRFRGTLDDWDPALLNELAHVHDVITFDSLGVGETEGDAPHTVEPMADFAAAVIRSVGLGATDILGWSLGGFVAQVLMVKYPSLVRKLILAGTTAPAGSPEVVWSPEWLKIASTPVPSAEIALSLFFTESQASRSAGGASFGRMAQPPASYVLADGDGRSGRVHHSFCEQRGELVHAAEGDCGADLCGEW